MILIYPWFTFPFSLSLEEGRRLLRGRNSENDTTSEVSFAAEVETMTKDEVSGQFSYLCVDAAPCEPFCGLSIGRGKGTFVW